MGSNLIKYRAAYKNLQRSIKKNSDKRQINVDEQLLDYISSLDARLNELEQRVNAIDELLVKKEELIGLRGAVQELVNLLERKGVTDRGPDENIDDSNRRDSEGVDPSSEA